MWVATPRQRQSAGGGDIARSMPWCDRDLSVVAHVRPPKGPFGRIQAPDGTYAVDPGRTHITRPGVDSETRAVLVDLPPMQDHPYQEELDDSSGRSCLCGQGQGSLPIATDGYSSSQD